MYKKARTFLEFIYRDAYVYWQRSTSYFINYCIIYPAIFSFAIGYLQANLFFGPGSEKVGTIVFIGHVIIIVFVLANNLTMNLLFDLEGVRFIDYQITILSPRLVLLERIIFASLFTFIMAIPFFPIAKLILMQGLVTQNTSWFFVYVLLYIGALSCAAYHQFAACVIESSRQMRSFWMRFNFIMITLGGIFTPWYITYKFSPLLGYLMLLNPLVYITDGLRQAIVGGKEFLPIWVCIIALCIFTTIFTILSWHAFKKKVDHI